MPSNLSQYSNESSHDEILKAGLVVANSARVLLEHSSVLLQRCVSAALQGRQAGLQFYESLVPLRERWNITAHLEIENPAVKGMLAEAIGHANSASITASKASLTIRTAIGIADGLSPYLTQPVPSEQTMAKIDETLQRNLDDLNRALQSASDYQDEIRKVISAVKKIHDAAQENQQLARQAAVAADKVLLQARHFLQTVKRDSRV